MNKWQRTINQIVKDENAIAVTSFRQRRINLRDAVKQPFFNFQKLIKFKNWNKSINNKIKNQQT